MVPISVRQSSCFEKLVFLNFLYTSAFGGLVGLLLFWGNSVKFYWYSSEFFK